MTIKDEIYRILCECGDLTTSELVDAIYPDNPNYCRSSKISTVYSKSRILEKWGKIERIGEDDEGRMVWRAVQ